ncbi:beta-1,4-galactosyltransferase 1-like [Ciona intestinalis]
MKSETTKIFFLLTSAACMIMLPIIYKTLTYKGFGKNAPRRSLLRPTTTTTTTTTTTPALLLCPKTSPLLNGTIKINLSDKDGDESWPPSEERLFTQFPDLKDGGVYDGPSDCKCRNKTAVIVPFRDREHHLSYFLYYLHRLLHRQQLCYVIFVVEQNDDKPFNRGRLSNIGFKYASNLSNFDCYIIHDVDMIAEDDRIIYTCRDRQVVHYTFLLSKYNYRLVYHGYAGGGIGYTKEQFEKTNGFPNEYYGWGGEDDDINIRINEKGFGVYRSPEPYYRFTMIRHGRDSGNPPYQGRMERLGRARQRMDVDGLNSLVITNLKEVKHKTHTRIFAT